MAKHLRLLSLCEYDLVDISEFNNSDLRTVGSIDSAHGSDNQDGIEYDLSLSLNKIDTKTNYLIDIKPDIKFLSSNVHSNCDPINSNISPFIKHDLNDLKNIQDISSNMSYDTLKKQEIPSHSAFDGEVKDELMYCQSCSYNDIDFSRLKFHIFREHPTGSAVVANYIDEANCSLHDIKLFCVKETCTFSSTKCNVYEAHLMSCCLLYQTLSEEEKERLKSTVKFILDFHSKHSLKATPGFMNYYSTFNTTFTCKDDEVQTNKDLEYNSSSMLSGSVSDLDVPLSCRNTATKFENSFSSFLSVPVLFKTQNTDCSNRTVGKTDISENTSLSEGEKERKPEHLSKFDSFQETLASTSEGETILVPSINDHDGSDNVSLEIDVAGSPIDISSHQEEIKGENVGEVKMPYNGVCCIKHLHVSSQQSGNMTRMTTEIRKPVGHIHDLYNGAMSHFNRDMIPYSKDLHFDMKVDSGHRFFKFSENVEVHGHNMDFIQDKGTHTIEKLFKCNECGKTFGDNSNRIKHRRTRTGEKPFECNDYGKTFSYICDPTNHRRTHTGEKPFSCNECGKTFSQIVNIMYS